MPHFFFNKKVILLLIGMVFLVALISFSLRDRTNATLPEQIIKDTVGFAQSLVAKPANYINGVFNSIDSLLNTYEENKRLKARLEDFAVVQAEATDLKSENNKLRELLDKTESLKAFNPIQATVIARNPDQWEEKIILDKGSSHGVKKNMAVMTAKGLVGKITLVTPFTSEVGIFPKGVPIGEIMEVSTDDHGLTKMAYVKPSADFSILEHVVIAKRTSTSIDGSDGNATNEDLSNPQEASEEEAE